MTESNNTIASVTIVIFCRQYLSDGLLNNYGLRIQWNFVVIKQQMGNYASVGIAAPYFSANIYQAVSWKPLKFVAWMFSEPLNSYWNFRAVIYTNDSIEGLSVKLRAGERNCQHFPFRFQRAFYYTYYYLWAWILCIQILLFCRSVIIYKYEDYCLVISDHVVR